MAASTNAPPLAKYLASTDKKTRDKAVKNLAVFLSNDVQNAISELEVAKLWKGIFYCFWMSDKPLVQQALASELAELVLTITDTPSSLNFLKGFWKMTVREWSGIDRLRMDKYYMLVRKFTNASFRLLIRTKWDSSACQEWNIMLTDEGGPLCPSDIRVPTSLSFHLADIYLEELDKALEVSGASCPPAPLATLLPPFFVLASRTPASTTYRHLQEALFDPLFIALQAPKSREEPNQKRLRLTASYPALVRNACASVPEDGPIQSHRLRKVLLQKMFDVASEEEARDSNRRKMYNLFKACTEEDDDSDGASG